MGEDLTKLKKNVETIKKVITGAKETGSKKATESKKEK